MPNMAYIRRLAKFKHLRGGLTTFIQKSMVINPKGGKPSAEEWKDYTLYEDAIEGIAISLNRKPHKKQNDKLFVLAHLAKIIKTFIDKGEFYDWCSENQVSIASAPWGELRRELALIMNLMMELESYSVLERKKDGSLNNQGN